MNDILKDRELVESDTKVTEKDLIDEKNDTLLRERLDKFLGLCFPGVPIYDWQKGMILEMYKWMKDHPDEKLILARGSSSFASAHNHYALLAFLAFLFRSMYDVDETLLQRTDED